MQTLEIVVVVFVIVLALRGLKYLKAVPIKPQTALILAVVVAGVGAYNWNWGGFKDLLVGVAPPTVPDLAVTPGATFEVVGSETDANLTFDGHNTFTCSFYENTASSQVENSDSIGGVAMSTVTFTLTLYRTDMIAAVENAVTKISSTIPTWKGQGENAHVTYYAIDWDTTLEEYKLAMTPAGGSARNEYTLTTCASGGSKAVTIVATLSSGSLRELDNLESKEIRIHTAGADGDFTLRFTKIGETA